MSTCYEIEVIPHCFKPNNILLSSVTVNKYVKFKDEGKVWYFATSDNPDVAIDPATFLGGGTMSIGVCTPPSVQRNWTRISSTTSGVILAGATGVSITNIGDFDALVNGVKLISGMTEAVSAQEGDNLSSITYDATGTEIIISELR